MIQRKTPSHCPELSWAAFDSTARRRRPATRHAPAALIAQQLEDRTLLSGLNGVVQLPLPETTGEVFVVDDWNNDVTLNDIGFNSHAGNTGATESLEGLTTIAVTSETPDSQGGSLEFSFDFSSQPGQELFAGYFASLWGLTDTLVSLDGSGTQPLSTTQFPGYFLDTQDIFRDSLILGDRSVEALQFDVLLQSAEPVTLKIELNDEHGMDVFARRTIDPATPVPAWETISLSIPSAFSDSVAGAGDPSGFDWRQVSTFAIIVERVNVGAGIENPDAGKFLIDNLELVDTNGQYPDLDQIQDPVSLGLLPQYEDAFLDHVRATSSLYFLDWASTDSRTGGIIQDRSTFADLMTVGGVGFQLTSYVIDAERGYLSQEDAATRALGILRVLHDQPQGADRVGTIGNEGFFYHFLGIDGLRKQNFDFEATEDVDESKNTVELSTIDTALAIAGVVTAGQYFDGDTPAEAEIRNLANAIYSRVNWNFMLDDDRFTDTRQFFLAWKPNEIRDDDSGRFGRFKLDDDTVNPTGQYASKDVQGVEVPATIDFYTDEGLLIALLAMGSPNPDHRLGRDVWDSMFREDQGDTFIKTFPGALFTYEFLSVWLDTERLGTDSHPTHPVNFFENTQHAVHATRDYAIANPEDRATWRDDGGENRWGVSAAEGPFDGYFAHAAPPAALAADGGLIEDTHPEQLEAEAGTGDGSTSFRPNASGGQTIQLDDGESRTIAFDVTNSTRFDVIVRYSNDNFGPLETIEVFVDAISVGSFEAQDTGDFGLGWDTFASSDPLGPVFLDVGGHDVTVSVSGGDGFGVEVDVVMLKREPELRPLADGTSTVYGAGSAIVHAPEESIAALWESTHLGLLHSRIGFADAFTLDIADAVRPDTGGPNVLRTSGSWANFNGFSIDHGPMLVMIDNYLEDNFVPRLFMSHPEINDALDELFPDQKVGGDVTARVANGSLILVGDEFDNEITIDQVGLQSGQYRISSVQTTINGSSEPVIVEQVTRDILAFMGRGDDSVAFSDIAAPRNIIINGGLGDNVVTVSASTIALNLTVRNGGGDDIFELLGSTVNGHLSVVNGRGGSQTTIAASSIGRHVNVRNNFGLDHFFMELSSVDGSLNIINGHGGSLTQLDNTSIGQTLRIIGDRGADDIEMSAATVQNRTIIRTGRDDDAIVISDSVFSRLFVADGGPGTDNFFDGLNNIFGGPRILRNFES